MLNRGRVSSVLSTHSARQISALIWTRRSGAKGNDGGSKEENKGDKGLDERRFIPFLCALLAYRQPLQRNVIAAAYDRLDSFYL